MPVTGITGKQAPETDDEVTGGFPARTIVADPTPQHGLTGFGHVPTTMERIQRKQAPNAAPVAAPAPELEPEVAAKAGLDVLQTAEPAVAEPSATALPEATVEH